MLDQHRRQLTRERDKRLRLSRDAQAISRRLSEKRPKIATATTESTRRSRQREVESLERDLIRAEAKVGDQDKVITALQIKIDKEQDAEQKKRDQAEAQRQQERARRDRVVDRDLQS